MLRDLPWRRLPIAGGSGKRRPYARLVGGRRCPLLRVAAGTSPRQAADSETLRRRLRRCSHSPHCCHHGQLLLWCASGRPLPAHTHTTLTLVRSPVRRRVCIGGGLAKLCLKTSSSFSFKHTTEGLAVPPITFRHRSPETRQAFTHTLLFSYHRIYGRKPMTYER